MLTGLMTTLAAAEAAQELPHLPECEPSNLHTPRDPDDRGRIFCVTCDALLDRVTDAALLGWSVTP